MFTAFAHSQLTSQLYPRIGIAPVSLSAEATVNTYSVSPQPAAGIDSWISGGALFGRLLMVIMVSSVGTGGTLTVTLRDSGSAITTANGDASTNLVGTLATISAAGLYYAEFNFEHVFASTLARVVSSEYNETVRRYHSVRAVAATDTVLFSILNIYGANSRDFPTQAATSLAITWAAS